MLGKVLIIYGVAVFLIFYGSRSLRSGLKKENKTFWINTRYDGGGDLLKDKYPIVMNIVFGAISIFLGMLIVIGYTVQFLRR